MNGHTKGPWKISTNVPHRVVDDFATIAHCNVSSRTGEEAEANARLIAAAPELLEALKNLASLAKDSIPDAEDWHDYHHALLAIAKAEGK